MTFVILGASAGVGRSLATRFAAAGHNLVLLASDERDLVALASDLEVRYKTRTRIVAADMVGPSSYLDGIAAAVDDLGPLDGVLAPVGAVAPGDDCTFDERRIARLTTVNYQAVVATVTRFLPDLMHRPRATVVGFGSVASVRGRSRNVAYAAAKRALRSFFESLRHACASTSVVAQFYILGYMDTAQAVGLRTAIPLGDPDRLSSLVLRNIGRDVGEVYYPAFWRPLSALVRCAPWFVFRQMRF